MKGTTPRSYDIPSNNDVSFRRTQQYINKVPVIVSTENREHCRISSPSDTHQDKICVHNQDSDHGDFVKMMHTPVRTELLHSARIIQTFKRQIEEM